MRPTERELKVLERLVLGMSDKEIARSIGVQPVTVRSHVASLRRKLGAQNRAQLAARALVLGLIDDTRDHR